jgi:ketosteroid isomerase-like protein
MVRRAETTFRRISEAQSEGRFDDVLSMTTDDVVYVSPAEAVEPGERSGRDAIVAVLELMQSMVRFEVLSVDRAEDRGPLGAVAASMTAAGVASGDVAQQRFGVLLTFEGELVSRYEWWPDPERPFAELAARGR